jgi:transposase-like protein
VAPYASQPAPLEAGGQRTGDAWHSSYRLRTRSRPSNARYRRAVKARGHFPTEQAALKCLYLVTRSLYPTGTGRARWAMRWKPASNAFTITFSDRFPAAETY